MGRLGSTYRNARSTTKKEKKLEKSNSSPTKEGCKISQMNSRIEKEAKNKLNEIDSFENLFSANNNFLQDLCFDQSIKNSKQNNELSGWGDNDTVRQQIHLYASAQKSISGGEYQQEMNKKLEKGNSMINEQNNITERRTQRAVSANICAGQTPLQSGRKLVKCNDQYNYNSAQKQSKNLINANISPIIANQQSTEKKNNSFSSPQVLLSNLIGSNLRYPATPKINTDQSVAQFEIGSVLTKQRDITPAILLQNQQNGINQSCENNNQTNPPKDNDEIPKNTISQWKNYLDRYDSSQDLYNVNPCKKRLSALQSFDSQKDEEKICDFQFQSEDDDEINRTYSHKQQEQQKTKLKNSNLSIDIASIKIINQNQSAIDEQKLNQSSFQMNQSSSNVQQKDYSSRQTYRTSKSSQANRIFGKKKKRFSNIVSDQNSNNKQNLNMSQYQQQLNKSMQGVQKDIRQRTLSYNLMNSEENCNSSTSLCEIVNKQNIKQQQQHQQQNILIQNEMNHQNSILQQNNGNNQSSQIGIKLQKRIVCNSSFIEEQQQTVNPNLSLSYQPQDFLSQKNTQAYFIQQNQNTTPQGRFLENQDLKNIFQQILIKSKEEKDTLICNKSQILKSISSYQPKRALNYNSVNAALQLGKEKIKQVIQQKNNQRVLRQIQNNQIGGGTQSLNNSMNLGYQNFIQNNNNNNNKSLISDSGTYKLLRNINNLDLKKDDQILKNLDNNERIPYAQRNQNNSNQPIKKSDENIYQNIKKLRAKSILKSDNPQNSNEQLYQEKKHQTENVQSKILKPQLLNIVANENYTVTNKGNSILQSNNSIKLTEKCIGVNQSTMNYQDKKPINNRIYNTNVYSNLLTKF